MRRILQNTKTAVIVAVILTVALAQVAYADLKTVGEINDLSGFEPADTSADYGDDEPWDYTRFTTDGGAAGGLENYHTNNMEVAFGTEPAGGGASESEGSGSDSTLKDDGRMIREAVIKGTSSSTETSGKTEKNKGDDKGKPGEIYTNDDPVHRTETHDYLGGSWTVDYFDEPKENKDTPDIGGVIQRGVLTDDGKTISRTIGEKGIVVDDGNGVFTFKSETSNDGGEDGDPVAKTVAESEGMRQALKKLDDNGENTVKKEDGSTDKGKYTTRQLYDSFNYNGKTITKYEMVKDDGTEYEVQKSVKRGNRTEEDPKYYEWQTRALDDSSEYNLEWHNVSGSFPANESRRMLYRTNAWGRITARSRLIYDLYEWDDWTETIEVYDKVTGEHIATEYEEHHDLVGEQHNLAKPWENEGTVINPLIPNNEPHPYLCYGEGCSYDCAHTPGVVCSEDDVTVRVDDHTELVK